MEKAKSEKKREYFKNGVKACLRPNEKVELVVEMYEQFINSLKNREEHIKKLYGETKQIKRLRV